MSKTAVVQTVKVTKPGIMNGLEGEIISTDKETGKAVISFGTLGTWTLKSTEFQKQKTK